MADLLLLENGTDRYLLENGTDRFELEVAPTYYIAPTGNDTTGDGSIGNPWRTIQKFIATIGTGGGTLNVRAGDYQGTDIGGIHTQSLNGGPDSWITVQAYAGDAPSKPRFLGASPTPIGYFWWFDESSSYIKVDGLEFVGWRLNNTAVLTSSAYTYGKVHHIRWTNIVGDLADNNDSTAHFFYTSAYVRYVEIDHNNVDGKIDVYGLNHNGSAVQDYHSDGADDIWVHHNLFRNWQQGVVIWDDGTNNYVVEHNTFLGCYTSVDARYGKDGIVVWDNAGNAAMNVDVYNPNSIIDTLSNNVWTLVIGSTVTSAGYLMAGSPAIGAAHDATDCGWQPYSAGTSAPAELASGTGTARTAAAAEAVFAGLPAGAGTAHQPSALASSSAPAATASGTGTALAPAAQVRGGAPVSTGTGTAPQSTPHVSAMVGP